MQSGLPEAVQVCLQDESWWSSWSTSLGGGTGYFTPGAVGHATIYFAAGDAANTAYQVNFVVFVGGTTEGSCSGTVYGLLTLTVYLE